jgi:hypothetical protein
MFSLVFHSNVRGDRRICPDNGYEVSDYWGRFAGRLRGYRASPDGHGVDREPVTPDVDQAEPDQPLIIRSICPDKYQKSLLTRCLCFDINYPCMSAMII